MYYCTRDQYFIYTDVRANDKNLFIKLISVPERVYLERINNIRISGITGANDSASEIIYSFPGTHRYADFSLPVLQRERFKTFSHMLCFHMIIKSRQTETTWHDKLL